MALVALPAVHPVPRATQTPVVDQRTYDGAHVRQTVLFVQYQHPVPHAEAHPETVPVNK